MAVALVLSRAQLGLAAPLVSVEVHLAAGLPAFNLVGLPAPVVRESRERVRAAMQNSGFEFPPGRITVNLAPVELCKEGGRFDLPIALGLLLASGQLRAASRRFECYGELGLSGELKPVSGLVLAAAHAAQAGHALLLPAANLQEARLAGHASIHGCSSLREACDALTAAAAIVAPPETWINTEEPDTDSSVLQINPFGQVKGQWRAKRALIVATAGGHSLLMTGPPGSGKTLLASCAARLLPRLNRAESLEVATIASVASGALDTRKWGQAPFRAPHHSSSAVAIVGGGPRLAPGEITLAHRGVLFLDELPEFDRRVLESLREPLESGHITLSRAAGRLELPADFQLVVAMNPCPCGYFGDASQRCRCSPRAIARYQGRISGPLLDRIDLRIEVPRPEMDELIGSGQDTAFDQTVQHVAATRSLQQARTGCLNARLPPAQMEQFCRLDVAAAQLLESSRKQLMLSGRGLHRVLRVARTIADLAGRDRIELTHLAEAIQLRRDPMGGTVSSAASGYRDSAMR